jgi:hypothetical protein
MGPSDSCMVSMALKAWWRFWDCTANGIAFTAQLCHVAAAKFIFVPDV